MLTTHRLVLVNVAGVRVDFEVLARDAVGLRRPGAAKTAWVAAHADGLRTVQVVVRRAVGDTLPILLEVAT